MLYIADPAKPSIYMLWACKNERWRQCRIKFWKLADIKFAPVPTRGPVPTEQITEFYALKPGSGRACWLVDLVDFTTWWCSHSLNKVDEKHERH